MSASPVPVRYCENCGRKAAAEARFCGGCGRPFPSDDAPDDGAAEAGDAVPAGSAAPAAAKPAAKPGVEADVVTFRPLAVTTFLQLLLCVVTLGIAWVVLRLLRLQASYRITTQRIEIRTGFLSVTRKSVELFRVQDFEIREPLFLRLRGSGDLVVRSMDPGEPTVLLDAVPDVQEVHDTLRRLVADERRRTNVRTVEGDDLD